MLERTAELLEESAALADRHATWEADHGRHAVAAEERRRAEWARKKAQLARTRAARP